MPIGQFQKNAYSNSALLSCQCGGNHFYVFDYYDDEDGFQGYFEFTEEAAPRSLWERLKVAAAILWRGKACFAGIVASKEDAQDFADFIKTSSESK